MKTFLHYFAALFMSFMPMTMLSQNSNCDWFTVLGIEPDPTDPSTLLVQIAMAADENTFINYPYIPVIWDCNGDTLATGNLFFFGQFGQTTQEYPVTTTGGDICFPVSIQFTYENGLAFPDIETCVFTYGESSVGIPVNRDSDFSVFPNPTSHDIHVTSNESMLGKTYSLWDATGKLLYSGRFSDANDRIDLSAFHEGVYLLRIENKMIRVVRSE